MTGCFFDCFESLPRALRGLVNTDIDGIAYRREDGQLRPFANPLRYRERVRRYATALWLIGRPPALLQSNNFDNSYGPTWFVESMNHRHIGRNLLTQGITPDKAAAFTASFSGMGICRSDVRTAEQSRLTEDEEQCFTILMAYGILHDLSWGGTPDWLSAVVKTMEKTLREELAISDPRVRHVRYWNIGDALAVSDARVLVGGFVHPENERALLVVLNPTEATIGVELNLNPALLDRAVTGVQDILAEAEVADGPAAKLDLEPHGVRILMVE